ncbi:MAG: helix-turn-helix transcriptional regulator [Candidatus Omnitrophica bacterium]|nr:helix-turn-helix transcriptional regulator [Candidatus Omnitrophota bacterium]
MRRYLEDLVSSFGRRITQRSAKLSPKEIEVCGMLKGGLSSKEISEFLNVSRQTIDTHRKNIRKKLGLSKKKVNLTSFLQKL